MNTKENRYKILDQVIDYIWNIICISLSLGLVYLFLIVFCFGSFKIPSDSMEPQLMAGDQVLVNKLIAGPRLFNVFASVKGKQVDIYRAPGFGEIRRNDIVVFNNPHALSWDRIDMHIMRYYIKRCVGLPGDSIRIEQGFYKNNHTEEPLGNLKNQNVLSGKAEEMFAREVYHCFPFDSLLNWNIHTFGPLYIPREGDVISLNRINFLLYRQLINWELKDSIVWKDDAALLKDKLLPRYKFQKNYYFVAGDKVENSQDSRYLGLIPEEYIVGVAWKVIKSIDPYTGEYRKERFWKNIR